MRARKADGRNLYWTKSKSGDWDVAALFAQGWAKRGTVSLSGQRQRRNADTACNNKDVEGERKSKSWCRLRQRHWDTGEKRRDRTGRTTKMKAWLVMEKVWNHFYDFTLLWMTETIQKKEEEEEESVEMKGKWYGKKEWGKKGMPRISLHQTKPAWHMVCG